MRNRGERNVLAVRTKFVLIDVDWLSPHETLRALPNLYTVLHGLFAFLPLNEHSLS